MLKPPKDSEALEASGDVAMAICVHDDTAALGEPASCCLQDDDHDHETGQGKIAPKIWRDEEADIPVSTYGSLRPSLHSH